MEIYVNKRYGVCNLTAKAFGAKIEEDVAIGTPSKVDAGLIEQCFSAGFEMQRYNGKSDLETIKTLIDAFLSDAELRELRESFSSEPAL